MTAPSVASLGGSIKKSPKVFELRRRTVLPAAIDEVFRFFESPKNLAAITPASLRFRMLTPEPFEMKQNAVFDYVVRPFWLPMRWTTLITEYAPPRRFADVQTRGPYALWHHTHTFESVPGGTAMEDVVRYALPWGFLGRLALPLVRRQLNAIFDFREKAIARIFLRS